MPKKSERKPQPGFKLVEFTVQYQGYNAGERATFQEGVANDMIRAGVAQEPGVLAKAREAVKEATARKPEARSPRKGLRCSFFVQGIGDCVGEIFKVPKEGPVIVHVGEGDDVDEYEVDRKDLTVLED